MRQQANKKPEKLRLLKKLKNFVFHFYYKHRIRQMQELVKDAPPNVQRAFLSAYSTWLKNGGVTRDH